MELESALAAATYRSMEMEALCGDLIMNTASRY